MATKKFLKYLKIYKTLFKYSIIQTMAYRAGFLFQLVVELGWQTVFVVFFLVVLGNVKEIAGWNYDQVLFLTGLNIVTSTVLLGSIYILSLWRLPGFIKDGEIDTVLLKPVNSLFHLSLGRPFFTSFLAALPGLGLMIYAAARMDTQPSLLAVVTGGFLLVCGLIIAYSISVILSSLSFYFVNSSSLPKIAEMVITQYKTNPFDVYQGALRTIFLFIIPVAFVSSVPAAAMVRTVEPWMVALGPVLAVALLWLAIKIWNRMIKYYSSASS